MKGITLAKWIGAAYRQGRMGVVVAIICAAAWSPKLGAAIYTWNTGSAGTVTWSTSTDWSPSASTGGPGASDTVNLGSAGTGTPTVSYDAGASGQIGTLNMIQTTSGTGGLTLSLAQNLTIETGGSLYSTSGSGSEIISLNNSNLDIAAGSLFTVGSTSASGTLTSAAPIGQGTGTGGVIVDGTLEIAGNSTASYQPTLNVPITLDSGGVLQIDSENSAGTRLLIGGNFSSAGTGTIEFTSSDGDTADGSLYFNGASVSIGSGTTLTSFPTGTMSTSGVVFVNAGTSTANQVINLGVLFNFALRDNASGISGSPVTVVKQLSSTAISGSVSNAVDGISFYNTTSYSTDELQLQTNLNLASGQSTAFWFNWGTSLSGAAEEIDLNGYAYNATASTSTVAFAPTTTTAGSTQIDLVNSGASSISTGHGIFEAASFNLAGADVGVGTLAGSNTGNGVILEATAAGQTNDLGAQSGGQSKINPNTIFYYTGAGSSTLKSTDGRSIGGVTVGTASGSSSTLKLASAIAAQGNVTANTGSTLDLNNQALTLSGSASLGGSGAIANTGGTSSGNPIAFASGATGGFAPGGGTGSGAAPATLTLGSGVGVTLASTSTSVFDVGSASSYDVISGGTAALAGTLTINFLNGFTPTAGEAFTLFSNSTLSGAFTSITFEDAGVVDSTDLGTFSAGVLTMSAAPEPSALAMLAAALMLGAGFGLWQRRITGRVSA